MNRLGINDLRSEAKEQEQRSEIWEELFLYLVCIKNTYQAIAIDKDNFTKYQFVEAFLYGNILQSSHNAYSTLKKPLAMNSLKWSKGPTLYIEGES